MESRDRWDISFTVPTSSPWGPPRVPLLQEPGTFSGLVDHHLLPLSFTLPILSPGSHHPHSLGVRMQVPSVCDQPAPLHSLGPPSRAGCHIPEPMVLLHGHGPLLGYSSISCAKVVILQPCVTHICLYKYTSKLKLLASQNQMWVSDPCWSPRMAPAPKKWQMPCGGRGPQCASRVGYLDPGGLGEASAPILEGDDATIRF